MGLLEACESAGTQPPQQRGELITRLAVLVENVENASETTLWRRYREGRTSCSPRTRASGEISETSVGDHEGAPSK